MTAKKAKAAIANNSKTLIEKYMVHVSRVKRKRGSRRKHAVDLYVTDDEAINLLYQNASADARFVAGSSVRPTLLEDAFHRSERFFTDMVFDSFAVDGGGLGRHTQFAEKRFDDLMATT